MLMKYILNADEMKKVDEYSISGVEMCIRDRSRLTLTTGLVERYPCSICRQWNSSRLSGICETRYFFSISISVYILSAFY